MARRENKEKKTGKKDGKFKIYITLFFVFLYLNL